MIFIFSCTNDLNKTMHASTAVTTIIDDILAILIARKSAILHTMLANPMTYIVDEFKQYGRCVSACVEIESDYCFRKQRLLFAFDDNSIYLSFFYF